MSASPSFQTDGRGKWKRKKREPQITRKQRKPEDLDDEDDDDIIEDENYEREQPEDFEEPSHTVGPALDSNAIETEILTDGLPICIFPPVTKYDVNRAHASVMSIVALEMANLARGCSTEAKGNVIDLENVSYGQLHSASMVGAASFASDQERSDVSNLAATGKPLLVMRGKGVIKQFGSRAHLVPSHSDWFSSSLVNRLERQVVPHFFSGKSSAHTPQKYMECRNYLVAKHIENPGKVLTVSDCQGLITGVDNDDLTRIVRFLDHWGIINYCAARTTTKSWNVEACLREDQNGEIHVPSVALKSIDSLIKFDKPKSRLRAADVYGSSCQNDNCCDMDSRIQEHLSESHCFYCCLPMDAEYYQSQKEDDLFLCFDCFHDGRFVGNHSSLDFLKHDKGDLDGENWSDQETLLLLEALELYRDNWNEIAMHVLSKSKAQCIHHFIRLPMDTNLLENIDIPSRLKSSNPSAFSPQEANSVSRLPFSNSGNPVMALVAFLVSVIGPRVAAACAHASLAALSVENRSSEISQAKENRFFGIVSNSDKHGENGLPDLWDQHSANCGYFSSDEVEHAAGVGLSAAATKAKAFADHEEREIQRLSANIINHQLKMLELKLKQLAEVEAFLMRECEQVEKTRQRFSVERVRIFSSRIRPGGVPSQVNLSGTSSMTMVNTIGNYMQQTVPVSSHLYAQLMQREQPPPLFPMGPRLPPLASLQSSSSAPLNVMFSPLPVLSSPILRTVSGSNSGLG